MKVLIALLALLGLLLVAGCSESESKPLTGAVVSEVKAQPKTEVSQPAPQVICKDECTVDICDGPKFVRCDNHTDGCKHRNVVGLTIGKCGIKCVSDSNCGTNQKCNIINYECEQIEFAEVQTKVCEPNKRICDNLRILQCNPEGTEYEKIEVCKIRCSEGKCYADASTQTASDSLNDLRDSLQDLNSKLNDITRINKKIDDCAIKCADAEANIPAIKNEFYLACYEIYYSGGEAELDDFAAGC